MNKYDRFKAQINYRTTTMYVKGTHSTPLAAAKELLLIMNDVDVVQLRLAIETKTIFDDVAKKKVAND